MMENFSTYVSKCMRGKNLIGDGAERNKEKAVIANKMSRQVWQPHF
jgi:hypothetical protein